MKILLAKTAGFCMGVRRAVEMVLDATNNASAPIYTFGPLIHNHQVMDILAEKGVRILDAVPSSGTGTVLIRAHGVTPHTKKDLNRAGFTVIDATCPRVIKVQSIIAQHARQGWSSIIVGDDDHPEVLGLMGHADGHGYVAASAGDIDRLPNLDKVIVVAQTTQNVALFDELCQKISARYPEAKTFNTICDATTKRQDEVRHLAQFVEAMVVVGGHHSGNTKRLVEIVEKAGISAYHVESKAELDLERLSKLRRVGITAGASTPNWVIRQVHRAVEASAFKKKGGYGLPVFTFQGALLLTNIYVALGAGSLCCAFMLLQGMSPSPAATMMAFSYVLSMHILNNFIGENALRYNDPERAAFYSQYRTLLMLLAMLAGAAGLAAGLFLGLLPFVVLLVMSILGLLYNVRLVPERFKLMGKYRKIRDIRGSKTILIAASWGVVTALLPAVSHSPKISPVYVFVFLWATGLVFVRTAFFDVLDVQGDRIVGQETLATWMGEEKTLRLLRSILLVLFITILGATLSGWLPRLGLGLVLNIALLSAIFLAHDTGRLHIGYRLEFLVETVFILTGLFYAVGYRMF